MSQGLLALMQNPDQLDRLAADPGLIPRAVEEVLRSASPVMYFRRTATRDTEIRGVPVAKGDKVVMWYVSANYDEETFPDPYRFDVGRERRIDLRSASAARTTASAPGSPGSRSGSCSRS